MPTKQDKIAKRQQDDRNSNLIIAVFVLSLCYMLAVSIINRLYANIFTAIAARNVLWAVGLAALAAGIALLVIGLRLRSAGKPGHYIFNFINAGGAVAGLGAIVLFAAWLFVDAVTILYGIVPVFGVLMLVLVIFPRELFFASLPLGGGIVALIVLPLTGHISPSAIGITAVSLFGLAAYALLAATVRKGGGVLRLGGKELEVLPEKAMYRWIFLACLLTALMILLGFILGAAAARYALLSLVACFIILAINYTAKK